MCVCKQNIISIWTILWGCFEVTGWLKILFFNSSENSMQIPLMVNKIYYLGNQVWPHNDLLLLKTKVQYCGKVQPWTIATKFSKKFPISMLKKHRIIDGPNWNIMVQLIFNNFCFRPSKTNKDKKGAI